MENEKYVMHTDEHGFDIYVAPLKNFEIQVTDKIEEAEIWGERDVKSALKLKHHQFVTGLNFQWKKITENAF